MLVKSLEFKNAVGQKIKVLEIPVLDQNNHHFFMIQVRLEIFISSLYNKPQEKSCFSFRDYLKQKIKWSDFKDVYDLQDFRNNA